MSVVHAPEGTHPEGQFATDTFVFAKGSPDTLVLRRAYREQQERIKKPGKHALSMLLLNRLMNC